MKKLRRTLDQLNNIDYSLKEYSVYYKIKHIMLEEYSKDVAGTILIHFGHKFNNELLREKERVESSLINIIEKNVKNKKRKNNKKIIKKTKAKKRSTKLKVKKKISRRVR